jgi:DNA polymerase III epsilon subunit-like protein
VQDLAAVFLKHPSHASIGLKTAVEAFRLSEELVFHNALNDAIYTAEIFKIIQNPATKAETFNLNHMKQRALKKAPIALNTERLLSFAEKELKRKLTERDKKAIVKIYTAGRKNAFDPKFDSREDLLI